MKLEQFLQLLPNVWVGKGGIGSCPADSWRRETVAPNGDWLRVHRWHPASHQVTVFRRRLLGSVSAYVEQWDELDELGLQCVLFELWSRRTWWQKAISWMSSSISRLVVGRRPTASGSPT